MNLLKDKRGLTLMETVYYMGILALLLSAFFGISNQMMQVHARNSLRSRLAESAWLALNTITSNLETARSVNSTDTVYDNDDGTLSFTNSSGFEIAVDRQLVDVEIGGVDQQIERLRFNVNSTDSFLTDSDVEVSEWEINAVRDSDGLLTGIKLTLSIEVIDKQIFGYRQGSITYTTTTSLPASIIEL